MLLNVLMLIVLALFIRVLYYFYYYKRGLKYLNILGQYLNKQDKPTEARLQAVSSSIVHLIKITGQSKQTIPVVEAMGFGKLASMKIHPIDNLFNLREDVASANYGLIQKAVSKCRANAINTFNPIYWIEFIIYLPVNVLGYIGLKKDGGIVKLFQVVWWLFAASATIIGVVFNKEFMTWIAELTKNL